MSSSDQPVDTLAADSPVSFPTDGPAPATYPPDCPAPDMTHPEPDYFLFSTPERSLAQIRTIQAEMIAGRFTPPPHDWAPLPRARRLLTEGGGFHLLGLGDSIVNDTMRSGWVGLLQEAYPQALAAAAYSGSGPWGEALRALAGEQGCAYLDMTSPWAEYLCSTGAAVGTTAVHPHLFFRDAVHANEFGEQILARIMMAFWSP